MLANFFNNTKPLTSVFLIGLFFSYLFSAYVKGFIKSLDFRVVFWFLFFFGITNFIRSRNKLTFDNAYFFLVLVILVGHFPSVMNINSFFYSNLVLLIYARRVYSLQSSKNTIKKLFDSGFWMGISILIEPFSIVLFPLTFIASVLHEHVDYKKLSAPILGICAPLILFFTYHFWCNNIEKFFALFHFSTSHNFSAYNSFLYKYSLSFVIIFLLISFVMKTPKTLAINNTFRKNWILVCFHFLFTIILVLVVIDRNGSEIGYLFFPSAIIIANGLEMLRTKWYSDVVLILLFISTLVPYLL